MTPQEILALPMGKNDAGAATIRDYLKALLERLWRAGESFSGKRPFGNSGWDYDLYTALVNGGAITGSTDEDGFLEECDEDEGADMIFEAIAAL